MVSAARQKIDRQTMQLFDPEVEKPEHDKVLKTLFNDDESLARILSESHGKTELEPFSDASQFALFGEYGEKLKSVNYAEAVRLAGVAPKWASSSPVRVLKKQLEVLLYMQTSNTASRLMGFADLIVGYQLVGQPVIHMNREKNYGWVSGNEPFHALFEVKSVWPTAGALLRQLNLYSSCGNGFFGGDRRSFVVGPDASESDVVHAHGFRLVTFDEAGKGFALVPKTPVAKKTKEAGVF